MDSDGVASSGRAVSADRPPTSGDMMSEPVTTATAPVARADFGAWWMLAVLFSIYVFSFIDRQITSMLVTDIKADLKITDFQMGLILGPAFAIVYAVFGIPMGWFADRLSRRWLIFVGACIFGLATFLSGHAGSFGVLLAARIAVGVGEASLTPAASSLLAARFPRHLLTTAFSIYTMGVKIGTSGAYVIGGVMIASATYWASATPILEGFRPWQLVFMATGLPVVLLALLVFTFREPARPPRHTTAGSAGDSVFPYMWDRRRLFGPMLIGFSLVSLCNASLVAWVPTYLTRNMDLGPQSYGPVLGGISFAAAFTLAFKGVVVDWLYRRGVKDAHLRFYTWLLASALPIVALIFWVDNALIFMAMYGFLLIVATPIIAYISAATALIAPPGMRGRITGVFLFCLNGIGVGIGPLLVGAITQYVLRDEMKLAWSLGIVICTLMPLALVILRFALKPFHEAVLEAEAREGLSA